MRGVDEDQDENRGHEGVADDLTGQLLPEPLFVEPVVDGRVVLKCRSSSCRFSYVSSMEQCSKLSNSLIFSALGLVIYSNFSSPCESNSELSST